MAKTKANKETGLPIIISLVFFVLTTIGLGVFVYVLSSDQEAKDAAVAKAAADMKNARTGQTEAEQIALVTRVLAGVADGDDLEKYTQIKEGDKAYAEVVRLNTLFKDRGTKLAAKTGEQFNDAVAAYYKALQAKDPMAAPKLDTSAFTAESFGVALQVDDKKQLKAPALTLLDLTVRDRLARDLAILRMGDDRVVYDASTVANAAGKAGYDKSRDTFAKAATDLPVTVQAYIAATNNKVAEREKAYQKAEIASRDQIAKLTQQIDDLNLEKQRLVVSIKTAEDRNTELRGRIKDPDPFQFDEPQGKITARLADDIVEINLGSDAQVQPGLTFTVLPIDFPQKGRQSRVRVLRLPDERGQYKPVEMFVPKATLEVIEVLGGDRSRARLTGEVEPVRDRALPGDLLYNAVWRKGQADHVALVGIFDINGDGTDDIEAVYRDLNKMGIPVDAYLDLKTKKWVGKINERTRYVVAGFTPIPTANDPNVAGKTEIIKAIADAKADSKARGAEVINFRDFFGRTGYKVKLDVSEDRVNQAAARYLGGAATSDTPAPPPADK